MSGGEGQVGVHVEDGGWWAGGSELVGTERWGWGRAPAMGVVLGRATEGAGRDEDGYADGDGDEEQCGDCGGDPFGGGVGDEFQCSLGDQGKQRRRRPPIWSETAEAQVGVRDAGGAAAALFGERV